MPRFVEPLTLVQLLRLTPHRTALLGVDYGTAKIGFALAASLHADAQPLATVRAPSGLTPAQVNAYFVKALKETIAKQSIAAVVVGWPLDPAGGISAECRKVDRFVDACVAAAVFQPFVKWDERCSSAAARAELKGDRARMPEEFYNRVDAQAAVTILQRFIEAARTVSPGS